MKKFDKCALQQKLMGLVFIIAGLVPMFIGEDATVSILLIPLGSLLLFTKKALIYEEYYEEEE